VIDIQSLITTDRPNIYNDLERKVANHDTIVIKIKSKISRIFHEYIVQLAMLKGFYWIYITPLEVNTCKAILISFVTNSTENISIQSLKQ
jgi:hypothetical protein